MTFASPFHLFYAPTLLSVSNRSKNKHSFGEFISPEVDWKKKSPHSSNNKRDDTFSPMQFSGRKSGGIHNIFHRGIMYSRT